jgi:Fur family ferric uptake transcriptional regulator
MCSRCNYSELIERSGLDPTPNRVRVLETIGNSDSPVSAGDIVAAARRTAGINRVTVYRILDLLVGRGLAARMVGGGRSLVYGMAPSENHPAHPHFHCRNCGTMQCLQPGSLQVDLRDIERSFPGEIRGVEIRLSGICRNCLKKKRPPRKAPERRGPE